MALEMDASMPGGFRISVETGSLTTLTVDGWMTGIAVLEFQVACAAIVGSLVIDLTGLRFADEDGIRLLKVLRESGVSLVGTGPFMSVALQ